MIELLDRIVDEGKPVSANRTWAAVRKLFNWALQRGIIEASPVALVEMPCAERERERTLAPDEICAVWAAAGELGYPFGHFFRMLLSVHWRGAEDAGSDFDWRRGQNWVGDVEGLGAGPLTVRA